MPKGIYKRTEESRRKMSESHKRIGAPWNKGKKRSEEFRKKQSESRKGEKNPLWRGGISPIYKRIRGGLEYRLWRESVFKRDNYTCLWCGQRGGKLNADHIKRFSDYPELRFAIDNGRTLCEHCHKTTDSFAGRRKKHN